MRLKSLEIVGFKSFVDRTVVSFDEQVTGIVGPNGCGKSNIVDAIRWVMGEQSAKHLRGNAMEDVIFSGSETREPVGMSQVFLTFDNSDKRAPAQYASLSEIQVGRRLYRSGESEYFINKANCRLKDIIDLFLDTGVGTRAYSIIEQGVIGQVVSSKPLDRRLLIEEAAGISKFKSRKEAALRKIEYTKSNLLRLNDILSELQRQINSLNRQAKKAERYQKIQSELQEKEMNLAHFKYNDFSERVKSFENESAIKKEQEAEITARLINYENQIEEVKINSTELEKELETAQQEFYATNQTIKLYESEIEHKTREADELVKRGVSLEEELVALNARVKILEERIDLINNDKVEADCKAAEISDILSTSDERVSKLRSSRDELKLSLEEKQSRLMSDSSSLSELKAKLENFERVRVEITAKIAKNQSSIDALNNRKEVLLNEKGEKEFSINSVSEQQDRLSQEIKEKQEELSQSKINLAMAEEDLRKLNNIQNASKSRLESIEEMRKNLDGYRDGVKKVLLRSKQVTDSFNGVFGTIGDVIETDPAYEVATTAVLGDRLQFVVVESHKQGVEGIEYLKTVAGGRSSFIPLKIRGEVSSKSLPSDDGVIGRLTDYIKFTEDFKAVAKYLFEDVVVVRDLHKALNCWENNITNHTYVTLDGEVVSPSGVITGGVSTDGDTSSIAQKRKIRELTIEITENEQKLINAQEKVKDFSEKVQIIQETIEEMESKKHNLEILLVGHRHEFDGRQEELSRLDNEYDELVIAVAKLHEEKSKSESEYESSRQRCRELEKEKSELEVQMKTISQDLEAGNNELISHEKTLIELRVSLAQAEGRLSSITREIDQSISSKTEILVDIARKQDDIANGSNKVEILGKEIEQRKESLKTLIVRVEELSSLQQQMQGKYRKSTEEIRTLELSIKDLRKQRDEALECLHNVNLKLTEMREKVKYLVVGIQERYRIDLPTQDFSFENREFNAEDEEKVVLELKEKIEKMGSVNVDAIKEYEDLSERHDFIDKQREDLTTSLDSLRQAISKINRVSRQRFKITFDNVNNKFQEVFPKLFEGGRARLVLTNEEDLLESGVEIVVQPPGKRLQSISLLSGGEKALTAIAFIFSIFLTKPSPFCLLDEVDAPLDDANVDRFNNIIRAMTPYSQFVLITHNKRTMETTDLLYGVTMQEPGVSRLVAVKIKDHDNEQVAVA